MTAARRPVTPADLRKKAAAAESQEAARNVAYWSIATEIAPDGLVKALDDALAEATQTLAISRICVDEVTVALNSTADLLTEASRPWADTVANQAAIAVLGQQMRDIVAGAAFAGLNLLDGSHDASPLRFVSGFDATTKPGSFKTMPFQTIAIYRNGAGLLVREGVDITDIRLDSMESAAVALAAVRLALNEVSQYASLIKTAQDRLEMESNAESAKDNKAGSGGDESGARLQAAETQKQLVARRMPIVNQNSPASHALPKKAETGAPLILKS